MGVAAAKIADLIPQFLRDRFGDDMDLDSIADCGCRQDPDVEIIANLQPTLICANPRSDEALLQKLRTIAPVVTGEGGSENWNEDLIPIADAAGKGDEAQAMLDDYEASVAKVKDSQTNNPPTVSFCAPTMASSRCTVLNPWQAPSQPIAASHAPRRSI